MSDETLDENVYIERLNIQNGEARIDFTGSPVHMFAEEMIKCFHEGGGVNYVGCRMIEKETGNEFEVVIRRCSGLTPAELNLKLKEEIAELKKRLGESG